MSRRAFDKDELAGPGGNEPTRFNFYLPDEDRSAGWTNHCYVLQFVCRGTGATPQKAWEDALTRADDGLVIPEGFELPESLVAIRESDEVPFTGEGLKSTGLFKLTVHG